MENSKEIQTQEVVDQKAAAALVAPAPVHEERGGRRPFKKRDRGERAPREQDPFDIKIIDVNRVTKMYKGGRRMKLSVFVVVGDRKGKVGLGLGKGDDVRSAQTKAVNNAKKNMIHVNLKGNTIPHEVLTKYKASRVLLKPASPGTGIVAGSSMRLVAEAAGISDVLGKILGADNKITNAYATVQALSLLRTSRL
jgi:small subunit ribosomal protein S5